MKMRFLLVAATAFLFAACTNDVIHEDPIDSGIVTDPTADAWVSLKVVTPQRAFNTRGLNTTDKEMGTALESSVASFRAIFFDKDRNVTVDKLFTGSNAEFGTPGQPTGGAGEAFKITADSESVLIIANPSSDIPNTSKSESDPEPLVATYAKLNEAITNASVGSVSSLDKYNKFMMTNAKGGLEPSDANGTLVKLPVYKTKELAERNALQINIDRVVSKVRVFVADGKLSEEATVVLDEEGCWVLNVTNKSYFPVSVRAKTYLEETTRGCITPFDQYKLGSYRIDPNYGTQPKVALKENEWKWDEYNSVYNYYFSSADVTKWNAVGGSEYCFENTQTKGGNVWAYTTQVLFKAKFYPTGLRGADGELYTGPNVIGGAVQSGDWMKFNGGYYTWESLMGWIKLELTNKYNDKDPANYATVLATDFAQYPLYCGSSPIEIPDELSNGQSVDDAVQSVLDDFEYYRDTIEDCGAEISGGNFSYYKDGVCYYPIMIRHDDDKDISNNEFGEFGVVRNSVYDINITAVNNPGYPTIPAPDPNKLDEEDQNYLSVQINVNPWTWYKQNVQL